MLVIFIKANRFHMKIKKNANSVVENLLIRNSGLLFKDSVPKSPQATIQFIERIKITLAEETHERYS